ncbi:NAD(+) diphosphatase [Catellatospora sichuanensis]|uniref:NAD(+) diphosphatase n=1 Tax=Catellatospora sichuanensis TaxID=1969805 RepID=UPI001183BBF6|nr:NAD(+) diphosphatase [Catellatospora sichuanensis]
MTDHHTALHDSGLTYCGRWLDRAGDRRTDPLWIEATLTAPDARLIPLWRDRCLMAGAPQAPVFLAGASAEAVRQASTEVVFLGLDGDSGVFAADLSGLSETEALHLAGAEHVLDVRTLVGTLEPSEASTLAYARGLLHWNRHQGFCGACGAATVSRNGGHMRVCGDVGCARLLFPRIEPAVIMLVESAETPRRCLLALHKGSAAGGYSTLAGFVEIGESLEDAVRREVAEEAGVPVGAVTYVASQAWPFPSGLMVGFRATATEHTVVVDGEELVEARWFTRAELLAHAASGGRLGREDSIDRLLLHGWLQEGD